MTMKSKLIALIAAGLIAIGLLAGMTYYSITVLKGSVDEIGTVRLPSVQGLTEIESNALSVRLTNLTAAVYENDHKAQDKFAALLPAKDKAWKDVEKGWKLYEPLPQTKEEEKLWKEFEPLFNQWKGLDAKLTEQISQLSRNTDPKKQEAIFVEFYKTRDQAAPIFAKASELLDKIIALNVNLADDSFKEGDNNAARVTTLTIVVVLLTSIAVLLLGLFIFRSTFKQLGGEPALASDIANKIAQGDISSTIVVAADDSTSLLASMKRMSGAIQAMTADANLLSKAAVEGKLSTRADATKHQGDFQVIVKGVNDTLDAVIGPLNVTAKYVDDISKGVIPPIITDNYNGDFNIIKTNLNNLAGVPSILYGMLGLMIFVRGLEALTSGAAFGITGGNGRTLLSASLTMALLVLPILIINAQEAIRAVPNSLRQAAYGVGATKWETIRDHVLPSSMPGILTGTILALSRAMGETAPLIVVGASTFIVTDPNGPFSKFTALPILIYNWTAQPGEQYRNIAAAAIIVLLVLLISLNAVAIVLRNRYSGRR